MPVAPRRVGRVAVAAPCDVAGLDPRLASALAVFAQLLAPFLMAELGRAKDAGSSNDDGWLDQRSSPLGRRAHCTLARSGVLPARKVGRRWLVRRTDLDAFIAEHGRAPALPADGAAEERAAEQNEEAHMLAALAACGMELVAPVRPTTPKKARR